ncbi:MAG: hypothetical protein B7Y45_09450 [Sphingomonas sp. 28-66-16]|nr:MAG: hypothetical protein B7Y45_09450 [Sphingomonas sp. 28-66-16]
MAVRRHRSTRSSSRKGRHLGLGVAALTLLAAVPANAQADPAAEIDALARESAAPDAGLMLARKQVARGDLLGAVATLERVIMAYPRTDEAILFHASLLCRLDDPDGARVELDEVAGHDLDPQAMAEVRRACAPGAGGRRP